MMGYKYIFSRAPRFRTFWGTRFQDPGAEIREILKINLSIPHGNGVIGMFYQPFLNSRNKSLGNSAGTTGEVDFSGDT